MSTSGLGGLTVLDDKTLNGGAVGRDNEPAVNVQPESTTQFTGGGTFTAQPLTQSVIIWMIGGGGGGGRGGGGGAGEAFQSEAWPVAPGSSTPISIGGGGGQGSTGAGRTSDDSGNGGTTSFGPLQVRGGGGGGRYGGGGDATGKQGGCGGGGGQGVGGGGA